MLAVFQRRLSISLMTRYEIEHTQLCAYIDLPR